VLIPVPLLMALVAASGPQPRAVRVPARVTAGASDQLLGDLAPNGHDLYFVSDRDATTQVYMQDLRRGGPTLVFDHDGDATHPRVSPDGSRLLYISFKSDATGDACVMDLESQEHHCVTGPASGDTAAFWFPGGGRVGTVSRPGLHGNLQLRSHDAGGSAGQGRLVLDRNLAGPAISPDGRWLAFVPLDRGAEEVGVSFSQRARGSMELVRADGSGTGVPVAVDLPGASGFPAFSRDGKWLYFSQYLNDTNFDGAVDGNDHSVLFRLAFEGKAERPTAGARPEQLTSADWNCQYPAPAKGRLISTCARDGSLDVYTLPLDGAVPTGWDVERVRQELSASRSQWERLLLLGRLLALGTRPEDRVPILRLMARLHMELREYESAAFYTDRVRPLAGGDAALLGWADGMGILISHRRAERRLSQGRLTDRFVAKQREHLELLAEIGAQGEPSVSALARVVESEIRDVLGDEGPAEEALRSVDAAAQTDRFVLHLLAERDPSLSTFRVLAGHQSLSEDERLKYADATIRALLRGVARDARAARVADERGRAEDGSELALLLDVQAQLERIGTVESEEVRKEIFATYRANKFVERRRAIVMAVLRRSADEDDKFLLYQFANSWVSWLDKALAERKHAEALYAAVVLEEAYVALAEGKIANARGAFYGATRQTSDLEAHVGFAEARFREGKRDVRESYDKQFKKSPDDPIHAFMKAYLVARSLPGVGDDDDHEALATAALADLEIAARSKPRSLQVHQVRGYVAHQRYLRTGDKAAAMEAHDRYLLALDLARDRPRYRATLHMAIGLLQGAVGNHRLAIEQFDHRAKLPFLSPESELSYHLHHGRSLFQAGVDEAAVERGKAAVALLRARDALAPCRQLVLDRAALFHFAAGEHAEALKLYGEAEVTGGANALRNALMRGASALGTGDSAAALGYLEAAAGVLDGGGIELPKTDRYHAGLDDYRRLIAGLVAAAHREAGTLAASEEALLRRRTLLEARFIESDLDADLLELAEVSQRLAEVAYRAERLPDALDHVTRGLDHSDSYNKRTGAEVNPVGLALLRAAAELHIYGGLPLGSFSSDLHARVRIAYHALCQRPSPRRRADRFLLGVYLTLLDVGATGGTPP
jgi:hypothetical protein